MKEWQKAYIAGVIDADGTLSIQKHKDRNWFTPRLRITNTDKHFLDILKKIIGMGHVGVNRYGTSSRKTLYEYVLIGRVSRLISQMKPYIQLKTQHCLILEAFFATHSKKEKAELWRQLGELQRH